MPVMDGYDATINIKRLFRERGIALPLIVAITGHVEPQYIRKAQMSGMDEVFEKPVQVDQIKLALTKSGFITEESL